MFRELVALSALVMACVSFACEAVVLRHDVAAAEYEASADEFPALVDLPGDGHGVLISPEWVVTAAHAVERLRSGFTVTIAGKAFVVSRVFMHPGYKPLPHELTTGDAAPLLAFARARDDIALLRLATTVNGIEPVKLYTGTDEIGKVVTFFGKGSTGNGLSGQDPTSPNRNRLRRARNVITVADGHWIGYRFDPPESALPLEGMLGNGDSGGPVVVNDHGEWLLLGIHVFRDGQGDLATMRFATYGTSGYQARMSAYSSWIAATMSSEK